jgi:hypothetical protein
MSNIIDLNFVKSNFIFTSTDGLKDEYICNCGHNFSVDHEVYNDEENSEKSVSDSVNKMEYIDEDISAELQGVYQTIKMAEIDELKCENCGKDYLNDSVKRSIINDGKYFITSFKFDENDSYISLSFARMKPIFKPSLNGNSEVDFIEEERVLKFEKESRKLFFKDFKTELNEFDLDKVIKTVNTFFDNDIKIVMNVHELHFFINSLSNHVIDIKNINIIEGLLEHVRNRVNDIGIEHIKKVLSIFFGIIKYSNLSTIALTKDAIFLYELMLECEIPDSQKMLDSNATSPIKIFNFLTDNYIKILNRELEEEDKESYDFVYKSTKRIELEEEDKELSKKEEQEYLNSGDEEEIEYRVVEDGEERAREFKFNINKSYKGGKVSKNKGMYQVLETVNDGSISKLIYKKINRFSDYKQLIKFLKIVDKKQLLELISKYETEYLITIIDDLYFRNFEKGFKEVKRLLDIVQSYVYEKSCELYPNINGVDMHWEILKDEHTKFDYYLYDDALMMMELIGFKREKVFDKIKTFQELFEFHENMSIYSSLAMIDHGTDDPVEIERRRKNRALFEEFINKFLFLEDRSDYDGPLYFELHKDPARMIREGREMRHSGHSYTPKVVQRLYLMGSIYDRSVDRPGDEPDRFTVGFTYNDREGLEFNKRP